MTRSQRLDIQFNQDFVEHYIFACRHAQNPFPEDSKIILAKQDVLKDVLLRCLIEMVVFICCLPKVFKEHKPTT